MCGFSVCFKLSMQVWKMCLSPVNFTIRLLEVSTGVSTEIGAAKCEFIPATSWFEWDRELGYGQASGDRGGDHVPLGSGLPCPLEVILSQEYYISNMKITGLTLLFYLP